MNGWEILGIDPTCDQKIIRKAYSTHLKNYPPEEYPAKFMQLRAAYEEVLKEVRENVFINVDNSEDLIDSENEMGFSTINASELHENPENTTLPQEYAIARDLTEKAAYLLHSTRGQTSKEVWLELFQAEELWNFNIKYIFIDFLFNLLHGYHSSNDAISLRNEVLIAIDQFTGWTEDELFLSKKYDEEEITAVLSVIHAAYRDSQRLTFFQKVKNSLVQCLIWMVETFLSSIWSLSKVIFWLIFSICFLYKGILP